MREEEDVERRVAVAAGDDTGLETVAVVAAAFEAEDPLSAWPHPKKSQRE